MRLEKRKACEPTGLNARPGPLYFCRFLRVLPTIVGLVIGLVLVLKVLWSTCCHDMDLAMAHGGRYPFTYLLFLQIAVCVGVGVTFCRFDSIELRKSRAVVALLPRMV